MFILYFQGCFRPGSSNSTLTMLCQYLRWLWTRPTTTATPPPTSNEPLWVARPSPCQCLINSNDPQKMDPLMAAGFHNMTCSHLCRLPVELHIMIMSYLDPLTLQCLRRVCRLFLQLYCSTGFNHTASNTPYFKPPIYRSWLQPKREFWPRDLRRNLGPHIEASTEGYCADCQRLRMNKTLWAAKVSRFTVERLYCSGCGVFHPVALFSAAQRQVRDEERICIGREGYVRLCNHKVVTWHDIAFLMREAAEVSLDRHRGGLLIPLPACRHESHIPKHHSAKSPAMVFQSSRPARCIKTGPDGIPVLQLLWHTHLRFPKPPRDQEAVSADTVRRRFEVSRRGAAEFIAPQMGPGHLPEMNCLDPNRCSCLHYPGMDQLPHGWRSPPPTALEEECCRRHPQYRLSALRPAATRACGNNADGDGIDGWCGGHKAEIRLAGSVRSSSVSIDLQPCPSDPRCLWIIYQRSIPLWTDGNSRNPGKRVTMAWCQSLDPNSYNLTDDAESYGFSWCREPSCKNYYKYFKRAVVPVADTNQESRRWWCP